jgi:hypothetical protein
MEWEFFIFRGNQNKLLPKSLSGCTIRNIELTGVYGGPVESMPVSFSALN